MEVLAYGSTAALSDEFTLSEETSIFINSSNPTARANLLRKNAAGGFVFVAKLTGRKPSGILPAGDYKVQRVSGHFSVEHA